MRRKKRVARTVREEEEIGKINEGKRGRTISYFILYSPLLNTAGFFVLTAHAQFLAEEEI